MECPTLNYRTIPSTPKGLMGGGGGKLQKANAWDPDQTPRSAASGLDLH